MLSNITSIYTCVLPVSIVSKSNIGAASAGSESDSLVYK